MAPGTGALPPATEIDVAGSVSRYVSGLPPADARRISLALKAFEWLPFPWRFSRASLEARQGFLVKLDSSPRWWHQDMLLLLKVLSGFGYGRDPRVTAVVGYETRCEVAGEPAPTPESAPAGSGYSPLGDLSPAGDGEDCDVVIVGSGAGGAVAATVLAEAGLDVLVLEAGPYLDRHSYPDDPLEALETLYRDNGLTVAQGRPPVPLPLGRAVGGTTVINSGTCFRTPEHVLARWHDELGITWANELEPEFVQAEEMLDVRPIDVASMGRNGQLVMEGAAALGLSGHPLSRNAGRCVQCSSCPLGCRRDAKRAMHVSYLPRAVAAGARIRAGVDVRRVVFEQDRAVGVDCVVGAENGERPRRYRVRAKSVVMAGGAIGTPELLLRSGVRSSNGMLGRNLHIHPAAWIGGLFDEQVRGWDGIMQSYAVDEWKRDGLVLEATFTPLAFGSQWLPGTGPEHAERVLNFDHLASNGVHLSDTSSGRVSLGRDGRAKISYRLQREDARKLLFGIARAAEIFFAAGATEVYSQVRGMPVLRPGGVEDFEARTAPTDALRLEAFHPMGTARMAADPADGVVATDGSVHGYRDLYVADGSLMPTSLGVNPMITIIALASRVARQLAEARAG